MIILVDRGRSENEGDCDRPITSRTSDQNFMGADGRGLICLTLPPIGVAPRMVRNL